MIEYDIIPLWCYGVQDSFWDTPEGDLAALRHYAQHRPDVMTLPMAAKMIGVSYTSIFVKPVTKYRKSSEIHHNFGRREFFYVLRSEVLQAYKIDSR